MPEPTPHRCPMPTTEEPAPPACCLMLVWISSRIVIAATPPVASNLQTTTNHGPAVNARGYDQLKAEQEKAGKVLVVLGGELARPPQMNQDLWICSGLRRL